MRFAQDLLGRRGQGPAVDVVEVAHELQRRNDAEGVEEGRGQAGHHVQVGAGRLDEGEQGGAVDALAEGEDAVEVRLRLDGEIECFEPPVAANVPQVQHRDLVVLHVPHDVGLRELLRGFAEGLHEGVRTEGNSVRRQHGDSSSSVIRITAIVAHFRRRRKARPLRGPPPRPAGGRWCGCARLHAAPRGRGSPRRSHRRAGRPRRPDGPISPRAPPSRTPTPGTSARPGRPRPR